MGFLNPWLLLGVAGIAVPILIHLLNRFRHRRIEWAAMELLRRALVVRSRRIRIEDIILLVLRCLVVLLVALAMARPTLTAAGAKWFGAQEQVGAVIALDSSYSMAHRPGVASRFDRALDTIRDLKGALNPGDPISMVLMGNRPRVILRSTGFDDRRLEKALKESEPLPEPLNLESNLDQIATLVRETKAPVREVYILSDAQAVTWEHLSEKAKRSLHEIGADARIFVLPVPAADGENLAIANLTLASGSLRRGTTARLVADVRNFGRAPADRVAVTLLAGDKPVDQHVVDRIGAGESVSVPLFVRLEEPGNVRLAATLAHDALDTDNTRYAVARVRDLVRVLVVDGDPSDRPFRSETDYVVTALQPKAGGPKASLAVEVVPWMELGSKRFDIYDVIMLCNVPDVRQTQVDELLAFVQEGGGLLVTLGDKVNAAVCNQRFHRGETSILPAELQEIVSAGADAPDGRPLVFSDADHPLARGLGSLPSALMNDARITRYFKVVPDADTRTIFKVAGTDAPLLVERTLGRGRVLLFTSTADRQWTNLPIHPAYPILLHEAMTYLTTRSHDRPFVIGEPLIVPLASRSVETSVTFRSPAGNDVAVQVTEREGRRVARFDQADRPGFYEMTAPGAKPVTVAVNVDGRESDVRALGVEGLNNSLAGLPVRVMAEGDNLVASIRESRVGRELWRILMLAGLAVLALEAFLANRFSRAMAVGEAAAPESRRDAA